MIPRNAILCLLIIFFSCSDKEKKIRNSDYDHSNSSEKIASKPNKDSKNKGIQEKVNAEHKNRSCYDLSADLMDNNVFYTDTVTVQNTEELIQQLKSNRLIKLIDKEYILKPFSFYRDLKNANIFYSKEKQVLVIDSIKNLKIVGTASSKLLAHEGSVAVLKFSNSYNIHLDNITFGRSGYQEQNSGQSVLTISHSYNFNVSNCKLFASGAFGLSTFDLYNLNFTNSEITESTYLIFELEKSRKIEFRDTKFHNNNLSISVLGAFTNLSREIRFLNCDFLDNIPEMPGNPAFNFMDNYENFDDKILFSNCTFKNNKSFKWYGDKIKLDRCEIDSSDFIGLQKMD